MKKKQNEFSNALDKMELEVLKRSEQKKIEKRRDKLVEANRNAEEAIKAKSFKLQEEISRKGDLRDKCGIAFAIGVTALLFIVPYYRKDPVDFWFYVIVGLCYVSFYFFYKSSK